MLAKKFIDLNYSFASDTARNTFISEFYEIIAIMIEETGAPYNDDLEVAGYEERQILLDAFLRAIPSSRVRVLNDPPKWPKNVSPVDTGVATMVVRA